MFSSTKIETAKIEVAKKVPTFTFYMRNIYFTYLFFTYQQKPIGGIALPAAADISALPKTKPTKPQTPPITTEDNKQQQSKTESPVLVKPKKVGLFDDLDDDLFDEDIFSDVTIFDDVNKEVRNLFDDEEDQMLINSKKEGEKTKDEFDKGKTDQKTNKSENKETHSEGTLSPSNGSEKKQSNTSLFESKLESNSLFDSTDDIFNIVKNDANKPSDKVAQDPKELDSIFDDSTEEQNLFGTIKNEPKGSLFDSKGDISSDSLFRSVTDNKIPDSSEQPKVGIESQPNPNVSDQTDFSDKTKMSAINSPNVPLFDPTPPPFADDDWDVKSEHNLFDEDDQGYRGIFSNAKTNLFDDEPPSLFEEKR